jgi:penicillin-binding protein 2
MAVLGAAFLILALRLAQLQIMKGIYYRNLSENNRIRAIFLTPPRGYILDRNGEVLANTVASFDATVIPQEVPEDDRFETYLTVGSILGMKPEEIKAKTEGRGPARFRPRLLKRHISREEMAKLEARRIELRGIAVAPTPIRNYPLGDFFAATMGYMGAIGPGELGTPEFTDYDPADFVGRAGIEKSWEKEIRGIPGGLQVEVDVRGRRLRELAKNPAKPGANLVLTIDKTLQEAAEKALGEEVGSLVAMDVRTGDILAMASRPTYNPNDMAAGISSEQWKALAENPFHPLQNRAIQGLYAPGSTFKIIMAAAGLAEGAITTQSTFYCGGRLNFGGRDFGCWKREGHGTVNLATAIEQSCDVYFYQLGLLLGVDTIHDYSRLFGLGEDSGIGLAGEREGLVPSSSWKKKVKGKPWYAGETLSLAIGQGYLQVTPLQLAIMTATIANPSKVRPKPRFVLRIEDGDGKVVKSFEPETAGKLDVNDTWLYAVRDGMRRVVEGSGTGRAARVEGFQVAGKTGTAQVVGMKNGVGGGESVDWIYRDHALFVCFAPYDDPKIAIAVVMDHGGHGGSVAAPKAARVLEAFRDLGKPKPEENEDLVKPVNEGEAKIDEQADKPQD